MVRPILFGILWFIVIYFVLCAVLGGIAGYTAGSQHPESVEAATQAAGIAGAQVVHQNILLIIAGAILLSAMGSVAGVLPGTKVRAT